MYFDLVFIQENETIIVRWNDQKWRVSSFLNHLFIIQETICKYSSYTLSVYSVCDFSPIFKESNHLELNRKPKSEEQHK